VTSCSGRKREEIKKLTGGGVTRHKGNSHKEGRSAGAIGTGGKEGVGSSSPSRGGGKKIQRGFRRRGTNREDNPAGSRRKCTSMSTEKILLSLVVGGRTGVSLSLQMKENGLTKKKGDEKTWTRREGKKPFAFAQKIPKAIQKRTATGEKKKNRSGGDPKQTNYVKPVWEKWGRKAVLKSTNEEKGRKKCPAVRTSQKLRKT